MFILATDGMIVAASTTDSEDSDVGRRPKLSGAQAFRALGSGDPLGELDTYVFSYGEDSFTPARAAAHATALANRAEAALAAAEEKALRDFVVGLLPTAIRTGWVRMHDWTKEVNRKMRSAAASSQLSVQVRVSLASDHVRARPHRVRAGMQGLRS